MNRSRESTRVLVAVAVLLTLLGGVAAAASAAGSADEAASTRWTCSMHPQIILPDNSQQCPICFMDLIPLQEDAGANLDPNELQLSEAAVALADIATARVERAPAVRGVRLTGRVAADPNRERSITARFGGRLEQLDVSATGLPVRRGQRLAEIYSPELIAAQAELQAAARALQTGGEPARAAYDAVVSRLRLWGLDENEIETLRDTSRRADRWPVAASTAGVVLSANVAEGEYVRTGSVLYRVADLSVVWAVLDAWETDVASLRTGQRVTFTARALPGRAFEGHVLFIEPVVDARTRTVPVRVEVENPDGALRPGMLLSAEIESPLDSRGLPADPVVEDPLLIPATAPLLTGSRAVVYVRRDAEEGPVFSGREVVLGPRAGERYVVLEGLAAGEEVVTRGAFKIDSALQIQAKPSMMNPGHGAHAMHASFSEPAAEAKPAAVPSGHQADWGDGSVLTDYFALQTALAGDDDGAAAKAAAGLVAALEQVDEGESGTAWYEALGGLREAAAKVVGADAIDPRRLAFQPLSDRLWAALESFGPPSDQVVRRFHCPMAMDGAGADWIQDHATTANPYYGAMMLRCGSQTAQLGQEKGS